jgi:hypothetical protein
VRVGQGRHPCLLQFDLLISHQHKGVVTLPLTLHQPRDNRLSTRGTTADRGAWQEARKRNGPLPRPGGDCGMPLRGRDGSPARPSRNLI